MSLTTLYILFVLFSLLLFNALILLSRFVRQIKMPPPEEEYEGLVQERQRLESSIERQNEEIVELQMRIKELESSLAKTENSSVSQGA